MQDGYILFSFKGWNWLGLFQNIYFILTGWTPAPLGSQLSYMVWSWTWTSDGSRQTKTRDEVITLLTRLLCNLQIKNHVQTESRNHVDDVINQLSLMKGIPIVNINLIPCQIYISLYISLLVWKKKKRKKKTVIYIHKFLQVNQFSIL